MPAVTPHVSVGTRGRSLLGEGGGFKPEDAHQQLLSPSQVLSVSTLRSPTSPAIAWKRLNQVSEPSGRSSPPQGPSIHVPARPEPCASTLRSVQQPHRGGLQALLLPAPHRQRCPLHHRVRQSIQGAFALLLRHMHRDTRRTAVRVSTLLRIHHPPVVHRPPTPSKTGAPQPWAWGESRHLSHHLDIPARCWDQGVFWYQDRACRSRISKVGVAVGVPVAGLVLAIAIFTAFLVRAQRQKEEYRQVHRRGVGVGWGAPWGPCLLLIHLHPVT